MHTVDTENTGDTGNTGSRNFFGRFSRKRFGSDDNTISSLDIVEDISENDDTSSVYSEETIKTADDDERTTAVKKDASENRKKSTQIFVGSNTAKKDLDRARNDITKVSIYAKDVTVTKQVAVPFLELVRGDNKSWEAMAVDILRQKSARWNSILFDACSSPSSIRKTTEINDSGEDDMEDVIGGEKETVTHLDLLLSGIINIDNCAHLHLTGLVWSLSTSFAMQSMVFSKSLTKLQLDFIDLSEHVPALATSLSGNKSITCLIASRCGLLDDHLGILLSHLPKDLEELRIFGNKIRAKGLASLTDSLQNKSRPNLKILDISFQHVEPHEKFDIKLFCEALGGNKTLKSLDLDNDSLDDDHLAHIVAALCRNKTLEEIKLNYNKITGIGVAMIAAKFGEMKGLKKVSMYSNIFDTPSD